MAVRKILLRLTAYKRALTKMKMLGFQKVFSDNLAESAGVTAALVRKDFSRMKIPGNRRGGYDIRTLIDHLERILGELEQENVILIGAGNLGSALINRRSFSGEKIRVVAAFDSDPGRHRPDAETPILPLDRMMDFIREHRIRIAIMTVPESVARDLHDTLTRCGIEGILNFAPVALPTTEHCIVNNINLGLELETVLYCVINRDNPAYD